MKRPFEKSGERRKRLAVRVRDAGVQHRDLHAGAAGAPDRHQVLPRVGRVDARARQEVPLQLLPSGGRVGGAGIGRDPAGDVGDHVRRRAHDAGPGLQRPDRRRDALARRHLDHARTRGVAARRGRLRARVLHHDLAGAVRRVRRPGDATDRRVLRVGRTGEPIAGSTLRDVGKQRPRARRIGDVGRARGGREGEREQDGEQRGAKRHAWRGAGAGSMGGVARPGLEHDRRPRVTGQDLSVPKL